ncbi:MAG: hypothetical protein FWF78_03505 [Defluviitaleaceae bacterium]|nr:hypothetical protein [Defluviitaleaceae bacterium]
MNKEMTQHEKHMQALNNFAERVKKDPNIIAMLLFGSLAYGTVGKKSDIGITLIVRDGSIATERGFLADEDGIYVSCHGLREVSKFKKDLQELRGGYEHALLGSGRLVFSKDEALVALYEATRKIGEDDAPRAFASKIDGLYNWMWKAEKHITLINDPLYAQRFLQLSAAIVAEMELIRHRENPNREAIRRAQELSPKLMHELYTIPSTTAMTVEDAATPTAVSGGYTAIDFSLTHANGVRCEHCAGDGVLITNLQFMADIESICPVCKGSRFSADGHEIRYNGKSIAEVLAMTVAEALDFFGSERLIKHKLGIMNELGLGYLTLGQGAPTLSGGEAQRVKLAYELGKIKRGSHNMYILDEPTTGLHCADIENLLASIQRLVEQGHSVIVVEHNLDVVKCADYIIDMGPEGGKAGGYVVATGTPEQVAATPNSYTGQYLKNVLALQ